MSDKKSKEKRGERKNLTLELDESEYKKVLKYLIMKGLSESEIGTESVKLFRMQRVYKYLEKIIS